MKLNDDHLAEISNWLYELNNNQERVNHRDIKVHLDQIEVWADGLLAGVITNDGDMYVFVPSIGATTR